MKGIYESLRQKEFELQHALADVVEANERELRRVQELLQDALAAVNQLLGAEGEAGVQDSSSTAVMAIESKPAEPLNSMPLRQAKSPTRSSQSVIAACLSSSPIADTSGTEFP